MKNELYIGYSRLDVTPPLGVHLEGYYEVRIADGIYDPLEVVALAAKCGDKTVLIITVDHTGLRGGFPEKIISAISETTGVAKEAIFLHSTHSHTAPRTTPNHENPLNNEYAAYLLHRTVDACVLAIRDLAPARMSVAVGEAKNVAFVRRFRMKDGSVRTNPGIASPDIDHPIGSPDESVNVVRFDRAGKETVLLVNFANHPDVIYGTKISADWPGHTRRYVEKSIDNVKCIVLNGAQGDINHVNVFPSPAEDKNFSPRDYSDIAPHYLQSHHVGRVITGAVLSVFDLNEAVEVDSISYLQETVNIPSNRPKPEEMPLARKYYELHMAGRDDEIPIPKEGMKRTTAVAAACRMVELENGPDFFEMSFSALRIGPVAFFGIPGEPFSGIGKGVKAADGYKMILPCCLVNECYGYFPMRDSYEEGGYEAGSSRFACGVAEKIIEVGVDMLGKL